MMATWRVFSVKRVGFTKRYYFSPLSSQYGVRTHAVGPFDALMSLVGYASCVHLFARICQNKTRQNSG